MKIPNIVSKTFTSPPIILKIFRPEISMVVEISTDLDLLSIIEFQIYSFILPILQANLGKILAKILSSCIAPHTAENSSIGFLSEPLAIPGHGKIKYAGLQMSARQKLLGLNLM